MVTGLWVKGYGLWVMGFELCVLVYGFWVMGYGFWVMGKGLGSNVTFQGQYHAGDHFLHREL